MFYYVEGPVALTAPNLAVIDCGGVGYACSTTSHTLSALQQGKRARLYTYLHVREDQMDLFGFADEEELRCFKMLLGISGVGPKAALSILSSVTPGQLALSILSGDTKALTAAPGVGKKLAQRIRLVTKDQLSKQQGAVDLGGVTLPASGEPASAGKTGEALAALQVLGYSQSEAAQALKGLDAEHATVEDLIRQALRKMMA